jgi:hypothetical protein
MPNGIRPAACSVQIDGQRSHNEKELNNQRKPLHLSTAGRYAGGLTRLVKIQSKQVVKIQPARTGSGDHVQLDLLRPIEELRIECGTRHFKNFEEVCFRVVSSLTELVG